MSWNYRVFRNGPEAYDNTSFSIREVYYTKSGKPQSYSEPQPVMVYANYLEMEYKKALRKEMKEMLKALDKPVLTAADFKGHR